MVERVLAKDEIGVRFPVSALGKQNIKDIQSVDKLLVAEKGYLPTFVDNSGEMCIKDMSLTAL